MPDKIALSVIVPCYNEEKNISLIVERFDKIRRDIAVELILVDNGSKDGTRQEIRKAQKIYPYMKLAQVKKNIGYGYGIMTGLRSAKGEYLCWTHADLQTDIADALKAYALIIASKDPKKTFVRGNRKGRSFFDNIFTVGMAFFETMLLGQWLWEINAQPKLFHKDLLKKAAEPPDDWSLDLYFYFLAKKNKFEIISVEVIFPERIHGKSHWNTGGLVPKFRMMKRTIDYSFELKRRLR
jgi:glycosyltransferase involved in cell wall biosynthesis